MRESYIETDFTTGAQSREEYLEYDSNGRVILDEYDEDVFAVAKETRIYDQDDDGEWEYIYSIYKIAELRGSVFDALSGNYRITSKFWKEFKFRTVKEKVFNRYLKYLKTKKTSEYAQVARSYLDD